MNIKKPLIISLIILITPVLLYFLLDAILVPKQTKVSHLLDNQDPSEFYFYNDGNEYNYNNRDIIKELNILIAKKTATRLKTSEEEIGNDEKIAVFDWGYKGRTVTIFESGRILMDVPKPDIRNKSRIHWLWWKININIDSSNYLGYITDGDKDIVNKILEIKEDIGQRAKTSQLPTVSVSLRHNEKSDNTHEFVWYVENASEDKEKILTFEDGSIINYVIINHQTKEKYTTNNENIFTVILESRQKYHTTVTINDLVEGHYTAKFWATSKEGSNPSMQVSFDVD